MQNNKNKGDISQSEDCLGCRLVSGFGVIGMGVYLFSQSKKQLTNFNKIGLRAVSAVAFSIGLARLLNVYPFNKGSTRNK